ncbi:hypothetical protein ACFV1L_05935 [Kitasatospora sp. NPDC059646]|uniref:hypothetical protein n=1 Tax=Kitasatospora sp. NPDC059646 TaxID=3346893 RepID=UPI0036C67DB5
METSSTVREGVRGDGRYALGYWTLEHGENLPEVIEALRRLRLDGVILSELLADQVDEVAEALDMRAYRSAETDVTANRNFLFMREGGCFRVTASYAAPYSRAPRIPPVNASVALVGENGEDLPGTLALVGHHAAYVGWLWRLWEAQGMFALIQDGWRVMLAADFNEAVAGSSWDFSRVTDMQYVASRTRPVFDGTDKRVTADLADLELRSAGYVDLAEHVGSDEALVSTAGYAAHGQGAHRRTDRWMADRHTAASVERVVTVTGLEHLSDHRPVVVLGSLAKLHASTLSGAERLAERQHIKAARQALWREAAKAWTPPV